MEIKKGINIKIAKNENQKHRFRKNEVEKLDNRYA